MKKYGMLALATIFMISLNVNAQDQPQAPAHPACKMNGMGMKHSPKEMLSPEKRADKMASTLGLTDAQKNDVKALFEKQDAKRKVEMEKIAKMRAEMKAKFEAQRKANDEDLTKIIGQEKFQKLQLMRAEKIGEMKGRMQERMREKRPMHQNHPAQTNVNDNAKPQN